MSQSRPLPKQGDQKDINWVRALKAKLGRDLNFTANIVNENLEIIADAKTAAEFTRRYQLLENPDISQATRSYSLRLAGATTVAPIAIAPNVNHQGIDQKKMSAENLSPAFGRRMLNRLFAKAIEESAIDVAALFPDALMINHVLYSKPASSKPVLDLWQALFNVFYSCLCNITFEQLRSAILDEKLGGKTLPGPSEVSPLKISSRIEGLAKGLFGVTQDNRAYFNYDYLFKMTHAAEFKQITQSDNNVKIIFDIKHLMIQMAQQMSEGVLFEMLPGENGDIIAQPIFFNPQSGLKEDFLIELVVDCSGSMDQSMELLKQQIIDFLAVVQPFNPTIRLVKFSDTTDVSDLYESIRDKKDSHDKLVAEIKKITATNNTRLNGTVRDRLNFYFRGELDNGQPITRGYNVSLVIFTDGLDSGHYYKTFVSAEEVKKAVSCFSQPTKNGRLIPRPRIDILEVNQSNPMLRDVAAAMGGHYYQMAAVEEFFKSVTSHLDEISCSREVVSLRRMVAQQAHEQVISIYANNAPCIPPGTTLLFPAGNNGAQQFELGDDKYWIAPKSPAPFPVVPTAPDSKNTAAAGAGAGAAAAEEAKARAKVSAKVLATSGFHTKKPPEKISAVNVIADIFRSFCYGYKKG